MIAFLKLWFKILRYAIWPWHTITVYPYFEGYPESARPLRLTLPIRVKLRMGDWGRPYIDVSVGKLV